MDVFNDLKQRHFSWIEVEKLVQELAWRAFFQNVWSHKDDLIFTDLKHPQLNVENYGIPEAILRSKTGITVLDEAVNDLKNQGYLHNHLRMYLASVCTNIAYCHWLEPAKWFYYHLLDGDLASNHLSWQWVAGSFSSKKYYANQENINKYFHSNQRDTFLDVSYEEFEKLPVPEILKQLSFPELKIKLPTVRNAVLEDKVTLIFNYYNLDYKWHQNEDFQKVLLLEPSIFEKFPISEKCLNFAIELSKNISNNKIFVGEFKDLNQFISTKNIYFKKHPLSNYQGNIEETENIFTLKSEFFSFFSYWKKIEKKLKKDFETNR